MPLINPDTSEASGAIEAGTYPAKITKVETGTSKSSGNPMIIVHLDVTVNGKVRPRTTYCVITGEGAFGFDQLLRATGFESVADQYKQKNGEKPAFNTDDLEGQELNVVVEPDTYNGQLRDRVQSYLKA